MARRILSLTTSSSGCERNWSAFEGVSIFIQMSKNMHHILSYRQGAFYGQYRIYAEDFLSVPIRMPNYEEQVAIGEVLNAADREMELLRQDLEQEKQKKKALTQLLLTGIVRVNA